MRDDLGNWIIRKLQHGVKAQGDKANSVLEKCGVPVAELRHQWTLQREAQTSIRARKYLFFSSPLCVLMSL
jgi:hypothetical protein